MQKLHLVGFTTDHEALIFSARKGARSGSFVVTLDDELVDAIDGAVRMRDGAHGDAPSGGSSPGSGASSSEGTSGGRASVAPRPRRRPAPDSALTPREIQSRLRAGRSIADVAGEAGVDQDWVERWAAPVIAEQTRVVDQVRALHYSKPRLGLSAQPLGIAVAWNLRDRGVELTDDEQASAWSAFQHNDGSWAIRLTYTSRNRKQAAEWELDPEGDLLARNRLASELAYVEPGRRRRKRAVVDDADATASNPPAPRARGRAAAKRRRAPATAKRATTTRTRQGPAASARRAATTRATATTTTGRATKKRGATHARRPTKKRGATQGGGAGKTAARRAAAPPAAKPPARRALASPAAKAPARAAPTVAVRRSAGTSTGGRRPRPLRAR